MLFVEGTRFALVGRLELLFHCILAIHQWYVTFKLLRGEGGPKRVVQVLLHYNHMGDCFPLTSLDSGKIIKTLLLTDPKVV